ncbi:MAG TPA: EF-hand domain-containing protein [Sphingobium sp.]
MRRTIALLLMLTTATAGVAKPAPPPPPTRPTITTSPVALMVAALDSNGDLRVTRGEFDAGVKRSFEDVAGGKTEISPIDLDHWAARWLGSSGALPGLLDFDTDGNDRISWSEFAARFAMIFAGFDANNDGVLDRSELISIGAARDQGGGRPGQVSGGRPAHGGGPPPPN